MPAVAAHGVVVAKHEIHLFGHLNAVFPNEVCIDFSIGGEGRAAIIEGEVGADGGGHRLLLIFALLEEDEGGVVFPDDGCAEEIEVFVAEVGVAGGAGILSG